jgi:hypothetical protein
MSLLLHGIERQMDGKTNTDWSSVENRRCAGTRLFNVLISLVIHRLIDPGSNYPEPVPLSFPGLTLLIMLLLLLPTAEPVSYPEPVPLSSRDGFVDTRFASRRIQGQVHGSQVCFNPGKQGDRFMVPA